MKNERVVYYSDPVNDDFAGTDINTKHISADFCFIRKSFLWKAVSFIVYYVIAIPPVWLISKLYMGLKFKNRRVLRKLRGKGYFLYGNHTQALDAYVPALASFPKRSYIIANPDVVSIPGIGRLVMMLGALPIPSDAPGFKRFLDAVNTRCSQRACIAVFPEAHIWPYYTGIRPFPDATFRYPVITGAPAVAMVTTYRNRKGLFALCKRPGMTVTFSDVFYPDPELPARRAQADLCSQAFEFMDNVSRSTPQVTYIRYEYKPKEDASDKAEE